MMALHFGFVNGSTPNISAMIAALADGAYVMAPPLMPLMFSDDALAIYDEVLSDISQSVEQLRSIRVPY